MERSFPERPWASLDGTTETETEGCLAAASAAAIRRSGPPCDLTLGRFHLGSLLPPGDCWIYACSTHSEAILDIVRENPAVRLAGFVDANAGNIGTFLGYPVITPQELADRSFGHVLVGHLHHETVFAEALAALGIEAEKIVRVYGNPTYWKAAIDHYRADLATRYPGPFETIIVTNNSVVVGDEQLSEVFDKDSVLVLYYGPPGLCPATPFPVVETGASLDLMYRMLEHYAPTAIYVRTFFDRDCIVHTIRRKFPRATLIHELFDLSVVFPDELLTRWNGWDARTIHALRCAEWDSFRTSDFVISKRGGSCWDKILAPFDVPYATAFSRLNGADEAAPAPDGSPKIAYAGYLSPEPRHLGGYYDLYPCFEALTADGDITVDIYNAGHLPGAHCDSVYGHYLARDHGGRINYHRAMDYGALIDRLAGYHFGWLYNERSETYIHDAAVTIPGRLTGYVSAGLPVILDDEFEFLADLIRRFNAGIVVPGGRTDLIAGLVRQADHAALREGVRCLRAYMREQNRETFDRLRRLVGKGKAAEPVLEGRGAA